MDGLWLVALVALAGFLETVLHFKQWRFLRKLPEKIPGELEGFLDSDYLWKQSLSFSRGRTVTRFGMVACGYGFLLTALFTGLPDTAATWTHSLMGGEGGAGVLLGALSAAAVWLVFLPWTWARSFMAEGSRRARIPDIRRFWNEQGLFLFLAMTVSGAAFGGAALILEMTSGGLWLFGAILFAEFLLIWLFPVVVIPMFIPVEPLPEGPVKERLQEFCTAAGLETAELREVNTSKSPRAGNAMLSGLGKMRRFLLFDSLLNSKSVENIEAIMAHEVGHLKRNHQVKRFLLAGALQGVLLAVIGVTASGTVGAAVILKGVIAAQALLVLVFQPLVVWFAQKQEFEADAFAARLVGAPAMESALAGLVSENKGWAPSDKFYSLWYEPHPPVAKRLEALSREDFSGR
ncbi:MAG: M48 family metalloprotease [Thermovirgaceae bacterium]